MKCPFCEKEIPGRNCPQCGAENPEEALYCMQCGASMEGREESGMPPEEGEEEFDFENRVLCPDGSCTGIIVNGRCTECGKAWKPGSDQEPAAEE